MENQIGIKRDELGRFMKGFSGNLETQFKKGLIPWSKGMHKEEILSYRKENHKIKIQRKIDTIKECKSCRQSFKNLNEKFCSRRCYMNFNIKENHPMYDKRRIDSSKRMKLNNPMFNEEYRKKLSETKKRLFEEHPEILKEKSEMMKKLYKEGFIHPMKGRHHTEKSIEKMSETHKKLYKNEFNPMLGKRHSKESIEKMKEFRKTQIFPLKDSLIEVKIQNFLKELQIDFFTHQYININHAYQCDILIPSMNLVIEADGNYWHKYPIGNDIDHIRTKELLEKGFKVLRLWEVEIKEMDIDKFKEKMYRGIQT